MASITLDVLTRDDAEQIRQWRNKSLESLRTPYPLTSEQQQQWYDAVVNNREANARWWSVVDYEGPKETTEWRLAVRGGLTHDDPDETVYMPTKVELSGRRLFGYTGIQHIDWINSHGEISLLIGPEYQGKGYGTAAVDAVLRQAFYSLNLHMVWGEAYPASRMFWDNLATVKGWYKTTLPNRVYRNGVYCDSLHFTILRGQE